MIDSLLYILYVVQIRDDSYHKLVAKFTCYFTAIYIYNCIYRCNNCIYRCTTAYIAVITVYMYITVQLYTHAWDKQSC